MAAHAFRGGPALGYLDMARGSRAYVVQPGDRTAESVSAEARELECPLWPSGRGL